MYELKIYRLLMSHDWRMMQNLKRNWLVSSKLTREIWRIFTRALKNLKNLQGFMFDGTGYWCKISKKNDLCFQKCHEEFGKFSPEHSKFWKFGFSWDPFTQSENCLRLKFTGELCVMTMKNDAKVEE